MRTSKQYVIGFLLGVIFLFCVGSASEQKISNLEERVYKLEVKANCTRAIVLECAESIEQVGNGASGDILTATYRGARLKEAQRRWRKENNRKSQDETLEEHIQKLREENSYE